MLSIYVLTNTKDYNEIGIAVSKKYSKSSVKRNKVKRIIKETYRLNEDMIKKGYSIVLLWKNDVLYDRVTYDNILNDLLKCLNKANLLIKEEEKNA